MSTSVVLSGIGPLGNSSLFSPGHFTLSSLHWMSISNVVSFRAAAFSKYSENFRQLVSLFIYLCEAAGSPTIVARSPSSKRFG